MVSQESSRAQPNVNVGMVGHLAHGKTTLTAAITTVLSKTYGGNAWTFDQIDNAPEEKALGCTISLSHIEYASTTRHYSHVDCPRNIKYVQNMISGASQMDAAILVVSVTDGEMPQTREHILLARQVGVSSIVVFLNKCDTVDDEELLALVEMSVRELLTAYDYLGDDVPVLWGSALKALEGEPVWEAKIIELVQNLDTFIPTPDRAVDFPFLLPIEAVNSIAGQGVSVSGLVERGIFKVNDNLEVVGINDTKISVYTGIEYFGESQDDGLSGEIVKVSLSDLQPKDVKRGMVLVKAGTTPANSKFTTEVYILSTSEGGRHTPIFKGYRPQFYFCTTQMTGVIELPDGLDAVNPGDNAPLTVTLAKPI
ncbi:cytochrome c oxidase subunit 1 [Podila verticillata]|nr:cytochrome c oxidase subunit 1 [Podila verticillata]KAI9238235.1 MAG: translation elongation factor Tu [Podila humilis]